MRSLRILLGFALFGFLAIPLSAQTPKDSAHVAAQTKALPVLKARVDSVNRALAQFCTTKNPPGYVKAICPVSQRALSMFPGLFAAESSLIAVAAVPPTPTPTPTPVPVDTQPTPIPTPTPTPVDTSHVAGDAELPRVFLTTTVASSPSNGAVIHVGIPDNLQLALETANCGDKILLAAGVSFSGNYVIRRACSASAWITVQTEGCATMPAEGVRVSPAAAACYAKLVSPGVLPALATSGAATFWRFVGVEFTNDASQPTVNGTVYLGSAGIDQNSLAVTPSDIILDRVYVHSPGNTDDRRCIALNSARTAIVDSYVAGCKSTFDSQAIGGTNGPGPYKIVNNYLEAAGENIAFGGADTGIPGLVPCDMEIRRNQITKPLALKTTQWIEKNLVESKNSCRVLFEGNVLEHSWSNAQVGWSFMLWSVNQGGNCPQCVTSDWTIRNNLITDAYSGPGTTCCFTNGTTLPTPAHHLTFRNNLWVQTGSGRGFAISDTPYLTIDHNTIVSGDAAFILDHDTRVPKAKGLRITNNVAVGYYAIFASAGQGGYAISFAADSDAVTLGNVLFQSTGAVADLYRQAGNFYPSDWSFFSAQLASDPTAYGLSSSSAYKGKATDGKDPGADIAAVLAAVAGVVQP
jgi:hypothetical protein